MGCLVTVQVSVPAAAALSPGSLNFDRIAWKHKMVNKDGKPFPTINELHVELRWLEWAKELSQESLAAITSAAEYKEYRTGEVVVELEAEITHVWFPITGRFQVTLYDVLGK